MQVKQIFECYPGDLVKWSKWVPGYFYDRPSYAVEFENGYKLFGAMSRQQLEKFLRPAKREWWEN